MTQTRKRKQVLPARNEDFRDARNLLAYVFRETIPGAPEPTAMQYDICDAMQSAAWLVVFGEQRGGTDAHGLLRPEVSPDNRIIVEAMRGQGKSVIAQVIAVWALYWNPHLNVLTLSASEGFAGQFSTAVLSYILRLPPLQGLAPTEENRQSVLKFDVAGVISRQHPSMKALGISGQIAGCRGNLIIVDDVETDENSRTEQEREKIMTRMNELASVRMGFDVTVTILLGTPHTEETTYNKLADERGFRRLIWPARYPDRRWMNARNGMTGRELAPMLAEQMRVEPGLWRKPMRENPPTDPGRFNDTMLLGQELQMGRSAFAMQMLLDTSLSDASKYPLKLHDLMVTDFGVDGAPLDLMWSNAQEHAFTDVEALGLSGDRLYRPSITGTEIGKFEGRIMSIDPSGAGGDAMGVCVTFLMGGMIFVPFILPFFGGFGDDNLVRICEIAKQFKVRQIRPEKNLGEGMFAQLLISKLREHYPECGVDLDCRSTGQKEVRIISTLEPVMNQHRLVFSAAALVEEARPIKGFGTEQKSHRLQHQLTRITKERDSLRHDDLVDVLAQSVAHWSAHLANTRAQAQASVKTRNVEELIASWYRQSGQPAPSKRPTIGHGLGTQRFLQQRRQAARNGR
jgi:hypothetical protein